MLADVPVHIVTGPDAPFAVRNAIPILLAGFSGAPPLLVPSTGESEDSLLSAVRSALHASGVIADVCVPAHGPGRVIRAAWATVEIKAPDLPRHRVRVSHVLADASPWIMCDVDAVARTGPFILDVFTRHLHPLDRLRLLADRQRERRAADLNLAVRPAWGVIGGHAGTGYLLAASRDPVAAELFALAMSELMPGPHRSVTGPWEDPVVQRATEIELGVTIPHQIALTIHGDLRGMRPTLDRITGRIGVDF